MLQDKTIVEASIDDLASALVSGSLTSVELVAKYLLRISRYDIRDTALNSIPLLNEDVFIEAAAADDRRAEGKAHGILDGIPYTVKDSYKVKGLTVASGSEAFYDLVANKDAFVVERLREAGAVLIGKTNMCPMAAGGMLRGVYGRAESPYNLDYLAAAFASGSSNGSGVSVGASFAAFGMGEETVSSGRSPASNNGLVAYTPSRGLISIRGNWPLYPTCDVIVPHTRTVDDLLALLDVITVRDHETAGDFWRDQPFVSLPTPDFDLSKASAMVKSKDYLKGKRIAVPSMYITQSHDGPYVSEAVQTLWNQTKTALEDAGAIVEVANHFPAVQVYEDLQLRSLPPSFPCATLPDNWNATERGTLIAHAWEDFLEQNASTTIPSLINVPSEKIFPCLPPADPQLRYTEPANALQWTKMSSYLIDRKPSSHPDKSPIYSVPRLEAAVKALEAMRKDLFDDWLDTHHYDYVVFPAVGDVARADSDINYESAEHAWRDGVKYSNGNRALRHIGIPSVTVPMGMLEAKGMPIGLTILGRAYTDVEILKAAYAFEQISRKRMPPGLTPPLPSDTIPMKSNTIAAPRPQLDVTRCSTQAASEGQLNVTIEGKLSIAGSATTTSSHLDPYVEIYIDGTLVEKSSVQISTPKTEGESMVSSFSCEYVTAQPPPQDDRNKVFGKIARDSTMIMALARNGSQGKSSGYLKLIHASEN